MADDTEKKVKGPETRKMGQALTEEVRGITPDMFPTWDDVTSTITRQVPMAQVGPGTNKSPMLVVVAGASLGAMHPVDSTGVTIGREPENSVALDDVNASRRHAVVIEVDGKVLVRDLDSKNGTYVGNEQITEHELQDNDLIHVGRNTLKYLSGDSAEQAYYQQLHSKASEDALTELPNRRYFDQVLDREFARAKRGEEDLVLVMADIDHFKNVNDTYGHLCGDTVLRTFARVLKDRVRRSEFFARYGGEEFAFILPGASLIAARIFSEAVVDIIAEHAFTYDDREIPITVSLGGALLNSEMNDVEDLIEAADKNLYEAKETGRNKAVLSAHRPTE
jgi:two-component system cell cycle response regulator